MNIGKACAIFEQIQKEKYSDNEKLWAIKDVLDMPTHNGITKDTILNTFKWFFDYAIEEAQEESTKPEVQTRWIPVTERLPKEGERVLVWYEYFRYGDYNCMYQTYGIGYQYEGHWSGDVSGSMAKCIAWMPLPEPWKVE